ncbi:flagellar basal-body rod protein FlgB [Paracoccus alcaliphilus]|uniref:Flagellar basal body rod protein FlgB n=1 Tax=Paracoccus alcaliphilus TaxID=34002 RepID=A0A1H8IRT2_9RHOB|nr:FlgB family protein [Paracoccus alcaliphilus]WCR18255.1 FlgB family protein [Paracoccus alcaliphilus]SEN71363.1 flagellar basal-body rod protein FlgB [Paracoccus alcaliphilus]
MFDNIEMLRMARALTAHAAQRQVVVARNIANSDTPGFKTRDLDSFASTYRDGQAELRQTRAGHIAAPGWSPAGPRLITIDSGGAPNGNTVSIEEEMARMAETRREHDLSVNIYRSAMNMMRTSIGKRN